MYILENDMKKIAIGLFVIFLAGCANPKYLARVAVLQNPQTKQTVECRVNPLGSFDHEAQIDNCITVYKKAGYILIADSIDDTKAPTQR